MIQAGWKLLMASSFGVATFFGNSVAQTAAPDTSWTLWLDRYGLPLVMLIITLYVSAVLYKALRESEKSRIEDKQKALEAYIAESKVAQEHRESMMQKMDEQTSVLREATRVMSQTKPCPYKPHE